MNPITVYDLVRVLADQQAGLTEQLTIIEDAIEEMDDQKIKEAEATIEMVASCMELLAGEVCERLNPSFIEPDDEVGYGEDELPW